MECAMAINSAKLRIRIESITDLPTLSTVVRKIMNEISNPSINAADIGMLIEQDPALAGKVLRLVNSAYYGFPKQIKSIQHAVVILGFSKIRTVVATTSVFDAFKTANGRGNLDMARFWQHSLGTAIAAKTTAEMFGMGHVAEDAFVGGLLHDIGKIVMDRFLNPVYAPVLGHALDRNITLLDAERELMGLTHALVGEWLIEKWRLPPVIVRMVGDHHKPNQTTERRELIAAVYMGDILARALGVGSGGDEYVPPVDPVVAANFRIDEDFLQNIIPKIIREMTKAVDFFSLISPIPLAKRPNDGKPPI